MANGEVTAYPSYKVHTHLWSEGRHFIYFWNDLGSTLADGDVYFLDWVKPSDSTNVPTLAACATSTVQRQIAVVANAEFNGVATVADDTWGWAQLEGYCRKVACGAGVAIGDFLQGANASAVAADDGTTQTADSFGIAVTAHSAGFCEAIMFGTTALIG